MTHKISRSALKQMRARRGDWYVYQNEDLGSPDVGHLQFLKCGENCTIKKPPKRMPDTAESLNWRYYLLGQVCLRHGKVVEWTNEQKGACNAK